jgi:hypothetical protein
MHVERVWDAVTGRSKSVVRGSDDGNYRPRTFDDGLLFVGLLVLVGIVVLGGLLALFYSVAATLPASLIIACPEFEGCPPSGPDNDQAGWVDDHLIDGPTFSP